MASAEEVQALKRELEQLKQLLGQNRRGGNVANDAPMRSGGSSINSSPTRMDQADNFLSEMRSYNEEYRQAQNPRRPSSAVTSPTRGKTVRWKDSSASPSPRVSADNNSSSHFVPIDTKRGKWWLKDRQVLSRNAPAPNDHTVAMKVRETWQWSGRIVIVDKIVTYPRQRDDYDEEEYYERDDGNQRRNFQEDAHRYRDELSRSGSRKSVMMPPESSQVTQSTLAAQAAFHDSKQLAKEFIQAKGDGSNASGGPTNELSEPMRTASQRMDAGMAKAAAAMDGATEAGQPPARSEPDSPSRQQLSEPDSSAGPSS